MWDTGLPTETNLPSFNTYGELTHDRFSDVLTDTTLFEVAHQRDALGRITQRVEEIDGVLRVFGYFYDDAGRLARVMRDGNLEGPAPTTPTATARRRTAPVFAPPAEGQADSRTPRAESRQP